MATKANLIIDQGSNFKTSINLTDDFDNIIDLTGYTGAAQIRKHYTSLTAYAFTVNIVPTAGEISLSLDANTSNSIPAGRYVYDCELTYTDGTKSRIIEGTITVTPQVTQ